MLLLRQLQEMAAAPVYVKGPLHIISDLMTGKGFGLEFASTWERCMLAQFTFAISLQLKANPHEIADQIDNFILKNKAEFPTIHEGTTLPDLVKIMNHLQFMVKGKRFQLDAELKYAHTVNDVISFIKAGYPVIIPIDGGSPLNTAIARTNYIGNPNTDGIAKGINRKILKVDPANSERFHAYLAMGYDSQAKQIIVRDIRHSYLLHGFAKVNKRDLELYMHIGFVFDVTAKEIKTPKLDANDERYAIAS